MEILAYPHCVIFVHLWHMYSYFTQGSGGNYVSRREHLLVSAGIREYKEREDEEFFIAEYALFGE